MQVRGGYISGSLNSPQSIVTSIIKKWKEHDTAAYRLKAVNAAKGASTTSYYFV